MSLLRGSIQIPALPEPPLTELTGKFCPNRMRCSGKLSALLARMLGGYRWTEPALIEIAVTSDSVFAVKEGDCGANEFIGGIEDFTRNLRGVVDTINPSLAERRQLAALFTANVTDHRSGVDFYQVLGLDPANVEIKRKVWANTTSHDMRLLNRQINYGDALGVMYASAFIEWAVENGWQFSRRNKAKGHDGWTAWHPTENRGSAINPAMFKYAMALGGIER